MILSTHFVKALPPVPIALPLLAATLLAGTRKLISRALADSLAIAVTAIDLIICGALLHGALAATTVYWFGNWYPRGSMVLGITFVIDPVSAGLATLAATLTLLALIFSWRFVDAGGNHFQPLMLVFLAGMTGFSLTGDLFNLFVFFELMSTAAFALCGLKLREPAPLQGAFNFAVTNTVAAFMVLTGIAFLYAITGALNMAQIGLLLAHRHDPLVLFACALITSGFLTKAAIVPFHLWLPDAHAVAPTPVCVLFSGVMVELGLYAVLRIYTIIFIPALDNRATRLRAILVCFATITVLLGSMMCYAEHHIKRLLAFSTVSHTGLMLAAVALAVGNEAPLAATGFLIYLLGHALIKSALFFLAGILLHRLRTASEPALFAKGRALKVTAVLWFLGALGLAAFPGFVTMQGEALTSNSAELAGFGWLPYLFMFAGILTAGAVFRVGLHTFLGWGAHPVTDQAAKVDELPETRDGEERTYWYQIAPPAVCIVAAIALSVMPQVRERILLAADRLTAQPAYLHTVYTGVTVAVQDLPARLSGEGVSISSSIPRGILASVVAFVLALTSVFRTRLSRKLRIGSFMEGPLRSLRTIQSGHVGDYVLWLTVGVATIGTCFVILLR